MKLPRMRRLGKPACFGMGFLGALCGLLGGTLMLIGIGPALYAQNAALILYCVMLLFLGVVEKGPENKPRRIMLLVFFFAMLAALPRLPLLDLLQIPAIPLLFMMNRTSKGALPTIALTIVELAAGVERCISIVPGAFPSGAPVAAISLLVLSLSRGAVILALLLQAKKIPSNSQQPSPLNRL